MNLSTVEKIANAVLYEGYVLYPYRPTAIKNHQRFNFGVLYPRGYPEPFEMQTECLIEGGALASIEAKVRFLQMIQVREWQEGIERECATPACSLDSLLAQPLCQEFSFDGLRGELELNASKAEDLFKITLRVRNNTDAPDIVERDGALLRSMVSVHSILQVTGGRFLSAIDPPADHKEAAAACQNIGTWPVLAGDEGEAGIMLSSPIILYDYPEIAPESPGDLCDGLEIDEILALRILTLTDDEKREVREGDARARQILERTEMLPPEHFQKLHGALRRLRPEGQR